MLLCAHAMINMLKNTKENKILLLKELITKMPFCKMIIETLIKTTEVIINQKMTFIEWIKIICKIRVIIQVIHYKIILIEKLIQMQLQINNLYPETNTRIFLITSKVYLVQTIIKHIINNTSGMLQTWTSNYQINHIIILNSIQATVFYIKIHFRVFPLKTNKLKLQDFK